MAVNPAVAAPEVGQRRRPEPAYSAAVITGTLRLVQWVLLGLGVLSSAWIVRDGVLRGHRTEALAWAAANLFVFPLFVAAWLGRRVRLAQRDRPLC